MKDDLLKAYGGALRRLGLDVRQIKGQLAGISDKEVPGLAREKQHRAHAALRAAVKIKKPL